MCAYDNRRARDPALHIRKYDLLLFAPSGRQAEWSGVRAIRTSEPAQTEARDDQLDRARRSQHVLRELERSGRYYRCARDRDWSAASVECDGSEYRDKSSRSLRPPDRGIARRGGAKTARLAGALLRWLRAGEPSREQGCPGCAPKNGDFPRVRCGDDSSKSGVERVLRASVLLL